MVDEKGHFLQVATRSTRKARRINRIKPPGAAGRNQQLRFAVRAGLARRSGRRWLAPSLRRITAARNWLRSLWHRPRTSANVFHTGADPHG